MKKKFICISAIVGVLLLVCIFGRGIYFYGKYYVPNERCFGSQYKEILHIMSFQDKKQANEIMEIVDDAFSFIGNKESADSGFGELSRYCITEEDAVIEEHDLKLVTADFNKNNGYLEVYNEKEIQKMDQRCSSGCFVSGQFACSGQSCRCGRRDLVKYIRFCIRLQRNLY